MKKCHNNNYPIIVWLTIVWLLTFWLVIVWLLGEKKSLSIISFVVGRRIIINANIMMIINPAFMRSKAPFLLPWSATKLENEKKITVNNVKITGTDTMLLTVGVMPIKVKKINEPAIIVALIWSISRVSKPKPVKFQFVVS